MFENVTSQELPFTIYVCAYSIITICVVTKCPYISFEVFLDVSNLFCMFLIDLNESSSSALTKSILLFLTKL